MQADIALVQVPPGYTRRQRWAIVASVSVLVAIMVAVAFAAGIYIGNNRELAPGIAPGIAGGPPPGQAGPQRFGQPQAPANQGVQQQQPANPAAPGAQQQGGQQVVRPAFDAVGSLAQAAEGTLTLVTPDGPRQIPVDGQTRFVRDDGAPVSPASLRPNTVLGVRLRPGSPVADAVTIITARGTQAPAP